MRVEFEISAKDKQRLLWIMTIILVLGFLFLIRSILLPFVVGILLAYFLDPAADGLEKWKFPRAVASFSIIATFFLLFTLFLVAIVPVIAEQLAGLVLKLPQFIEMAKERFEPLIAELMIGLEQNGLQDNVASFKTISEQVLTTAGTVFGGIWKSGMAFFNIMSLILITPIVAFYLLRDWDIIVARVDSLLPLDKAQMIREQMREVDKTLSGYIRGQTNVCLIMGLFYGIGLQIAGLDYGFTIGFIAGLLTFIPYVGPISSAVVGIGMAFLQFDDITPVIMVAAVFGVGQLIESNLLTPKMVGDKVGLHPMWIIFGMLAGAALFGFVGVFIAVPVTAVVGIFLRSIIRRYLQSGLYSGGQDNGVQA